MSTPPEASAAIANLQHHLNCLYSASPVVVILALLQLVDVASLQQQFLFLDNQQRSADSSSVRVNSDLTLSNVSDHRHLKRSGEFSVIDQQPGGPNKDFN